MIRLFYNIFIIPILFSASLIASIFSKKVLESLNARTGLLEKIEKDKNRINPYKKTVLFHCSSYGEYKQILPVMQEFIKRDEIYNVVLSLFSPSAYNNLKDLEGVNIITYTPFDTYYGIKKFFEIINPTLVIISKHDVWPNFIYELKSREVPVYLVNALFADDSKIGKWYAKPFFKPLYKNFTGIITVDSKNAERFKSVYPYQDKIYVSGDSRFDTVIFDANNAKNSNIEEQLKISDKIFVAGSSWPVCENIILKAWKKIKQSFDDAFLIIVPHEVNIEHIHKVEVMCQENSLTYKVYSDISDKPIPENTDVLIVDKIGILTSIYSVASVSYVGGGFGKAGIHSVLEPAVYGVPVLFGYNLDKSPEAQEMVKEGCGFVFFNNQELHQILNSLWKNKKEYNNICQLSTDFIEKRKGATKNIFDIITNRI